MKATAWKGRDSPRPLGAELPVTSPFPFCHVLAEGNQCAPRTDCSGNRRVGQTENIGRIELRIGNTHHIVMYGGHIGYTVVPEYRGHHYAARACRLLMPLARSHGLKTLWITCNPDNIASRRTCELLGARLVEIVDLPASTDMYKAGECQKCRYRLDI